MLGIWSSIKKLSKDFGILFKTLVEVSVVTALLNSFLVNGSPWEAVSNGSNIWVFATLTGDLDGVLASWLWPSQAPCTLGNCEVNQQVSLRLCFSLFLLKDFFGGAIHNLCKRLNANKIYRAACYVFENFWLQVAWH